MKILLTFVLALSMAGPLLASPVPSDDGFSALKVAWKGRTYAGNALPGQVEDAAVQVVETWAPWCLENDYQMNLVDDQRVLLISKQGNNGVKKQLKLIKQTEREFDKLLPAPERKPKEKAQPEPEPEEEIPEDPEGGPVGFQPTDQAPKPYTWTSTWGAGSNPVDSETCVMFIVRNEKEYGSLVKTLGRMESYLQPWVEQGLSQTGFVHETPLVGAYIEMASGMEEWDPQNELVHRVARMLFVRRYSSAQPNWVMSGVAWYLENKIRGAIYVYPYRSDFVFATEHTAWPQDLRVIFEGRGTDALELQEIGDWKRGSYDSHAARLSFGFIGYLSAHHAKSLSPFLEALRLFYREDSKEDLGGGNWRFKPNYQIPTEDQFRFLSEFFDEHCLSDAADYFREGDDYKPKKHKPKKRKQ